MESYQEITGSLCGIRTISCEEYFYGAILAQRI